MSVSFKMITLFIGFCFIGLCTGMGEADTEPKFVLNFDSPPYVCADEASESRMDTSGVEVVNYNETFNYLDGYVKFLQDIDTNLLFEVSPANVHRQQPQVFVTLWINTIKSISRSYILIIRNHILLLLTLKYLGLSVPSIAIKTEKQVSGQFETLFTHEICNLCDELQEGSPYFKYLKNIGFPQCPFAAGEYAITKLKSDEEDFPVTSSNAGRYLVTVSFYTTSDGTCKGDKTFLLCSKISFCVEPVE